MNENTKILRVHNESGNNYQSSVLPLHPTASYSIDINNLNNQEYTYSRIENPTRSSLQKQLAILDNALYSHASPSGLSAINSVLSLLPYESEIIFHNNIYGGTYNALKYLESERGIKLVQVDMRETKNIKKVINNKTFMIYMESPSNPLQHICEIQEICEISKNSNIVTVFDNTVISSYFQKPLNYGVDFCIQSGTKYLSGHGDISAGVISVSSEENKKKIKELLYRQGNALSPNDSWLLSRSLKTLSLRLNTQQQNCYQVAKFLQKKSVIKNIYYLGLSSHPQYELHKQQSTGSASVIAFNTKSLSFSKELIRHMSDFFEVSLSFGSIRSSISLPFEMSHQNIFNCPNARKTFSPDLIRLSIGIENINDILHAIDKAIFNCSN